MGDAAIYEFTARQSAITCCSCGVIFTMPEHLLQKRKDDHKDLYCPNGHVQGFYGPSEAEKLKKQLEAKERELGWANGRAKAATERADHEERRARAARGQVTKIKNRVGNGVCPCCNRTFQNLMRHMKTQHPNFAHDADEDRSSQDRSKP